MANELADIETLECPICRNVIQPALLDRIGLKEADLAKIEDLVYQKSLVQMLELGKLASKYLEPKSLGAEIQLKDSLLKLSDRGTEIIGKCKDLATELVKTSEEKKTQITQDALNNETKLIADFQNQIKTLQENYIKIEQLHLQETEKITLSIQQIREKILGTGIGGVRELTVIKDLKSACPEDSFSDEAAAKHGADIIATVKLQGRPLGKIVVSVKDVETWEGKFITQIKENMKEQQTPWSMLVTKTFPRTALNDRAYIDENDVLLVKSEYAPAAYLGLRRAVIQWSQIQTLMKDQEQKTTKQDHILKVLREWIQGPKFSEVLSKIDEAVTASKTTDDLMQKWQTYNDKQTKAARELQSIIRASLFQCNDIMADLQDKFRGEKEQ